jgi:hypothetical protein
MQYQLAENKAVYKALKRDIEALDEQAETLKTRLAEKMDEIDSLDEILGRKMLEVDEFEKITGLKAPLDGVIIERNKYKFIKGDLIDEMIARILNEENSTLPVRRLSDGVYMFGTKKITCKVSANNLAVRVGGGWSSFRDFLQSYWEIESNKIADAK